MSVRRLFRRLPEPLASDRAVIDESVQGDFGTSAALCGRESTWRAPLSMHKRSMPGTAVSLTESSESKQGTVYSGACEI